MLEEKKIIYTAYSKHIFFNRWIISKYVIENNSIPLNPFTNFDYFMSDSVKRDSVRNANFNLLRISNEIWVFGDIADGVLNEINYAKKRNMRVRYFKIHNTFDSIYEIKEEEVIYEQECYDKGLIK